MQLTTFQDFSSTVTNASSASGDGPKSLYYLTLQFTSPLDSNFSAWRSGIRVQNQTIPECTYFNGSAFVQCSGCNISTYTRHNATYVCSQMSTLCGSPSSSRRQLLASPINNNTFKTTASYSSVVTTFINAPAFTKFNPNLSQGKSVLAVLATLFAIGLGLFILFVRWDIVEYNAISLYSPAGPAAAGGKASATKRGNFELGVLKSAFHPSWDRHLADIKHTRIS